MCLIAIHPGTRPFSDDEATQAYDTNPHGLGCTYSNGKALELHLSIPTTPQTMLAFYRTHNERAASSNSDIVWHWRFRTHGPVSLDNTHPFPVLPNLAVAHNGVISGFGDALRSDTRAYVEDRLRPMAMKGPLDLARVERETAGSRLAFASVRRNGQLRVETTGTWSKHSSGARVSNTYWNIPSRTHTREEEYYTAIADSIYAIAYADDADIESLCEQESLTYTDPQWALRILRATFELPDSDLARRKSAYRAAVPLDSFDFSEWDPDARRNRR